MPNLPNLSPAQIESAVSGISNVTHVGSGGQKVVFKVTLKKKEYALKVALVPEIIETEEEPPTDPVSARAQREVDTMNACPSAHMVKLGPLGLTFDEIAGQRVLYFTEEFVTGSDLKDTLQSGPLSPDQVVHLGLQITDAIKGLWEIGKVHRDIKPGNIMRRAKSGDFVLLDAGLAFDVVGESLSGGHVVGTMAYFSPEQFDYTSRRTSLDFRSDMFSLGVTMYEAATGRHPFWAPGESSGVLFSKIVQHDPDPPSTLLTGSAFPAALDDIILQMLGKSKHLRFRTCDRLTEALRKV